MSERGNPRPPSFLIYQRERVPFSLLPARGKGRVDLVRSVRRTHARRHHHHHHRDPNTRGKVDDKDEKRKHETRSLSPQLSPSPLSPCRYVSRRSHTHTFISTWPCNIAMMMTAREGRTSHQRRRERGYYCCCPLRTNTWVDGSCVCVFMY